MSAHVKIGCERGMRWGTCPNGVYVFGVDTIEQARQLAARHGWRRVEGTDQCPECSGSPAHCPPILRAT